MNLTTALQNYLSDLGGVTVLSPSRVESIGYGPTTDELDLSSWPAVNISGGRTLTARLLVGADGANSPVRTFAAIQSRGWDYERMGLVATVRLDQAPDSRIAYQRFLPTGPIAMLPLPGNMASLVWSTTPERAQTLKALPEEDFCALVNAAFRLEMVDVDYMHTLKEGGQLDEFNWRMEHVTPPDWVPRMVTSVQTGTRAAFPLRMRHADTYTADRVALVG